MKSCRCSSLKDRVTEERFYIVTIEPSRSKFNKQVVNSYQLDSISNQRGPRQTMAKTKNNTNLQPKNKRKAAFGGGDRSK